MKVILYGATGMVGQGVLRECLNEQAVTAILSVGRSPLGEKNPKLSELKLDDFTRYEGLDSQLTGYDACFFCLGTTSAGKSEADYYRVTYDFTLAAATALLRLNPAMTFIYVSGDGADSSEQSQTMWARVRGKTENALLQMPFKAVYVFRPGVIQPLHGIKSKTASYRLFYQATKPLLPLFRTAFPTRISTTENIGRAMLAVVRRGYDKKILTTPDFNRLAASKTSR